MITLITRTPALYTSEDFAYTLQYEEPRSGSTEESLWVLKHHGVVQDSGPLEDVIMLNNGMNFI